MGMMQVGLILRALGYDNSTHIYIAAGIFGGTARCNNICIYVYVYVHIFFQRSFF